MKTICVLGSTGSVGTSTLDVIKRNREDFCVQTITAYKNVELLSKQALEHKVERAVIGDCSLYADLKDRLSGTGIECAAGTDSIIESASVHADITMAAIMGMAGLEPILAALKNGGMVAIANKEPLVAAGKLVMDTARKYGAKFFLLIANTMLFFRCLKKPIRIKSNALYSPLLVDLSYLGI